MSRIKMNGGLLLNETHETKSIEEAIDFFKSNSTFSIVTNSSLSCITFKATLNTGINSPFIHIRSGIIEQLVTTLLFKYYPILNEGRPEENNRLGTMYKRTLREYSNIIQLTSAKDIQEEYNLQLEIYQKTYNTISSAYEPVCPYPIHCFTKLDKNETIQEIQNHVPPTDQYKEPIELADPKEPPKEPTKITSRNVILDTLGGIAEKTLLDEFFVEDTEGDFVDAYHKARELITTLGCIVMEFMDEYTTLEEYLKSASDHDSKKAKALTAYEAVRLQHIGIVHGDIHLGNIMYNPNYKYITNDDKADKHKGRALIIDFGLSTKLEKNVIEEYNKTLTEENKLLTIFQWSQAPFNYKFSEPYTFEMIYRSRLEVTLAFRTTMIKGLESLLTTSPLSTAEKKKAKLKLDLITNSKWPTNFDKSKEDDFENEEFDTPFKEVKDPLIKEFKKKNPTLSEEKINEITKIIMELEGKAEKALVDLTYLTDTLRKTFLTPTAHGGRYINSLKKQNAFANRLHKTTLKGKRSKRSKRSKRRKRSKRKK